jgi:hypothetical protein
MIARHLKLVVGGLLTAGLALLLVTPVAPAQEKKDKLDLDKIPKAVMDALKAKFPRAEIHKWTKEKEGEDIIYDIEFKHDGRACEADIKENGAYINFERAVEVKDLPAAVKAAVEKKYPKASIKEAMEITDVKGKVEKLEGYEILLTTTDKKTVEITLAPDGKVLEESAGDNEEKK